MDIRQQIAILDKINNERLNQVADNAMRNLMGIKLVEINELYTKRKDKVKFCKSKKKRIIKKWNKNNDNYKEVRSVFQKGDTIFADRFTIESIKSNYNI